LSEGRWSSWSNRARKLAGNIVDIVLPPICANCGSLGELFCGACMAQIEWVTEPICESCGRPIEPGLSHCSACTHAPLPLKQIRAAALYADPIQRVLRRFKYEGLFALAGPLAEVMFVAWPCWQQPIDLVLPIPLHAARQRERGYNQAELLMRAVEQRLHWEPPSPPTALKRIRHTRPQVGMSWSQRSANVRQAFVADPGLVAGKEVLLIDDVYTTGATLAAAAEALFIAGVSSVSAYCLASAVRVQDITLA
jgi:ComF family protein